MNAFFVTGTDTGVGKTLVTAALLHAAGSRGLRTIGIKPLSAGCVRRAGRWMNADALLLQKTATVSLDYERVNPVALEVAMAPHLAAASSGLRLDAAALAQACRDVAEVKHDLLLAEGAGGWLVPLNERETMADLARMLGWPMVLVVGMRLGCLNHALLTATAIRAAELRLAGWVANSAWPEMPALADNIASLDARLQAPRLGTLPWLGSDVQPETVSGHLDLSPLLGAPDARV